MEQKSFIATLFDFSFSEFITPKVIKFIFIALTIVTALVTLIWVIIAFAAAGISWGLLALILSPVVFIWIVFWNRVALEMIIVFFQIHENVRNLAKTLVPAAPLPPPAPQL